MFKQEIKIIHLPIARWKEYKNIYIDELKQEPKAFLNSYEEIKKLPDNEWIDRISKRGNDFYFVEVVGKIVGMAGVSINKYAKNKHVFNLWGVYIKNEYRGRGLSKKLLEKIILDLRKNEKYSKISLGVTETQKVAQKLYESLGFVKVGLLRKEFFVAGKYYNEILMEKMLT